MNPNSPQKRMAFGYNRDYGKIVINEGQAAAVKLIFMYYLEGKRTTITLLFTKIKMVTN